MAAEINVICWIMMPCCSVASEYQRYGVTYCSPLRVTPKRLSKRPSIWRKCAPRETLGCTYPEVEAVCSSETSVPIYQAAAVTSSGTFASTSKTRRSSLKVEAICSTETSVFTYQITMAAP